MIVLAILIALVVLNKILYKSYLNPIFLQSVLWLVYYFFLMLKIDLYDIRLSDLSQFVLYQSLGFSLGGFVITLFTRRKNIFERLPFDEKQVEVAQKNILLIYPIVLGVLVITTLFLIRQTQSFSIFNIASLFTNYPC